MILLTVGLYEILLFVSMQEVEVKYDTLCGGSFKICRVPIEFKQHLKPPI